ncbi:P22 phage major capsid protein family protein [Pseudophaeobacter sp. 1A09344]|uniref:P22 phage major capsid protein family protein n=1 Tax=Pseudophaeobacter sp. 1A09344 TaxID=3098144 RepID=UPI0034D5B311
MANTLITPSIIAKEALMQLENNLVMANRVHREYKKEFTGGQGESVSIRRPVKFYTADGATRVNQDVEEKSTSITVDQRKHVSWNFSTQDLTLSVEEYSERYIKPAMITLANTVDRSLHGLYKYAWNSVGTPGTTPSSYAAVADAAQRLSEMAVDQSTRSMVANDAAAFAIAGNQLTLEAVGNVKRTAYEESMVGRIAKFDMFSTQNVQSHTVGVATGTPLVNGGSQNVTYANATGSNWSQTLNTDGWTNSTTGILKAGDVFTIAGVYAVNPVPGEGTTGKTVMPYLQQFTVLADADSGATTGPAALTISPPIITSGAQQTVSAAPADNAAITVLGTGGTAYPQNLGFHKNAFGLVTVPLEMPDGASFKARESHNGLSIRVVKDYDIGADTDIIRLDILYGVKSIYPDLACRLWG